MRRIRIANPARETELGDRIAVADRWWPRLRGLLGRPEPEPGEGLLIVPSKGVHMFFMKYPLDVLLLDRERRVVAVHEELRPWRQTPLRREARYALEVPAGTVAATGTEIGDRLTWNGEIRSEFRAKPAGSETGRPAGDRTARSRPS